MKYFSILILAVMTLMGCAYVPASENKADWFATVENGGPGKLTPVRTKAGTICLKINSTKWLPLFGPDGFGGRQTGYNFWCILDGNGSVYVDPDLAENGLTKMSHNRGTISIDRKSNKVTIDLQRIESMPGEPEKLVPSPANGTYPIKRWIK